MSKRHYIIVGLVATVLSILITIGSRGEDKWQVPTCSEITHVGAVTFSRDGGITITPSQMSEHYETQSIVNIEANTMLASINSNTIIITTDSGCHWAVLGATSLGHTYGLEASSGYAYGWGNGTLFRVDKSGITNLVNPLPSLTGLGLDREAPKVIKVGGPHGEILVSQDGGATWTKLGDGPLPVNTIGWIYRTVFDPNNSNHIMEGGTGGLFVSNDGGSNWQSAMGFPKNGVNVTNVVFSPNNVQWAMGIDSQNRFIYRSTDGGNNFSPVIAHSAEVPLPNQPVMAAHPTDANILYFVTPNQDLVKYDALSRETNIMHVTHRVTAIAFSPADPAVIYLGITN